MSFSSDVKMAERPESTTLFRNPAAGADITAFTMSHYGEGYYLSDISQYIVFTYKTGIFTFERGGFRKARTGLTHLNFIVPQ
jgi:hypothetical protein